MPSKTGLDDIESNRVEVDMLKAITEAMLHLLLG
jgi:hypothetical protein